jgi:hypothetical protein
MLLKLVVRGFGKQAADNLQTVHEMPLMYTATVYSQEGITGSPSMARLATRAKHGFTILYHAYQN